ncbi:DUF58 domain-containing protein [Paenibacillus sacheonensis]|uniref:DUF58 domain-containing protein n=1 Tax=Paenibacillus sacheonensis TaxID=742054 RepID=A0A7X5BX22_9BACL|nr:DUF58 domain-containing protein [Paenibacillus sacheonensis]MBM7563310.1 uncharacterized protein (DUF58 family) [Paenibacillus sacheonensis]NBC68132.1 DUF58 domain-containing protein [Paenibacillus sacheonensis]
MGIHWYIISAVIVIVLQRYLFRYFGMRKVGYTRSFSVSTCFEGDDVEMVEKLVNDKWLPVPWLRVESQLHAGLRFQSDANFAVSNGEYFQNHRSLFSLMGNKQLTRRHAVQASQRGCYRIKSASLTFGDLFGLFSTWKSVPLQVELLVYPLPADRDLIQLPSRSWQGDIAVRRWIVEDPFAISGVREYRPGDPLKMINWSATARTGGLQVHRRDYTADFRLIVLLNVEDHAGMWHAVNDTTVIEHGIRLAAGILQLATEQGLETAFACNGHELDNPASIMKTERGGGHEHLNYLFGQLSKLVIARTLPFDAMLEQLAPEWGERSDIVVISAFMSERIGDMMAKLRKDGHAVDWLPIAAEEAEAV